MAPGIHSIGATYSGDSNNQGSSTTISEYIVATTKTVLATSGSPSQVGQAVTFTATVSANSGSVPNGESVTFYDGNNVLGSAPLAGGTAFFATSSLSAMTHMIKAVYPGDPIFKNSSGRVTQVVEP
jgi:hypothetical protein